MYIISYGSQNDKFIWKLSNYLRYFQKKKKFKNFGRDPGPPWSSSGSTTDHNMSIYGKLNFRLLVQVGVSLGLLTRKRLAAKC